MDQSSLIYFGDEGIGHSAAVPLPGRPVSPSAALAVPGGPVGEEADGGEDEQHRGSRQGCGAPAEVQEDVSQVVGVTHRAPPAADEQTLALERGEGIQI